VVLAEGDVVLRPIKMRRETGYAVMIVAAMLRLTPTTVISTLFRNASTMRVPFSRESKALMFQPIGYSVTRPDSISCTSLRDSAIVFSSGNRQVKPSASRTM